MKTIFGSCWESFDPAPPALMKALADLGFRVIRLMAMWPAINPKHGSFLWDQLDASVDAIKAAGLQLYLDPYWAPAHASGGLPTYEPYTAGCTAFDGKGGVRFAPEWSWCSAPAPIDPIATQLFGRALARRYRNDVDFWGIWNEPGGDIYYPPNILGGDWGAQFCREIVSPFVKGVRSAHPDAKFIGPEADTPDVLDGILRHEAASGEHWYDIVSSHPYAWDKTLGFPADSYKRMDEFSRVAANYATREQWIGEIGPNGASAEKVLEFVREIGSHGPATVLFHNSDMWLDGANNLTALGVGMKGLLHEQT